VQVEQKLNGRSFIRPKTYGEERDVESLLEEVLKDRVFYEESGGGVTFSGGEPLMQIDALADLLKACKAEGLHTTVDTCGLAPEKHVERILEDTDLFLYDLKNMDPVLHRKFTGVDNAGILSNTDFLLDRGARLIIRIPVIPGVNTDDGEQERLFNFVQERAGKLEEVHLLPYHRIADHKYRRLGLKPPMDNVKEPEEGFMNELKSRYESSGLCVRIGG
jgi:pyruvate formate lyase activating enzyme